MLEVLSRIERVPLGDGEIWNDLARRGHCYTNRLIDGGIEYHLTKPVSLEAFGEFYGPLKEAIEETNATEELITSVKIEHENIIWPFGIDRKTGRLQISDHMVAELAKNPNLLRRAVYHEGAHIRYRDNWRFDRLWKQAKKLGIVEWFNEGNFENRIEGKYGGGHSEDEPSELYASASTILRFVEEEFRDRFYERATRAQKKVIDRVLEYVSRN